VAARATLDEAERLCRQAALDDNPACLGVALDLAHIDFAERRVDTALGRVEPLPEAMRGRADSVDDLAAAYELLALLRVLRNRPDESLPLFQSAIDLRLAQWGDGSVRLAQLRHRYGRHLWTLRRLAQAEAEMQLAWETTRTALGPEHVASARNELYLGRLQGFVGTRPAAMIHLRHAHQVLMAQANRLDPAEVYEAQSTWANALLQDGQLAQARVALDDAITRRRALGERAGPDPTLDLTQARWLQDTGRFAEARALLAQQRDAMITQVGADHPQVAERRLRLALAALASGDVGAADTEIEAALATQDSNEAVFGSPKHRARLVQVLVRLQQQRTAEAERLADTLRALAAAVPRSEVSRDTFLMLHEAVARAFAAVGRHADAAPHFASFLAGLEVAHASHPWLAAMRAHHAASLAALGDTAAAHQQLARARAALAVEPLAGPQFWQPVRTIERQLGRVAAPG
jgi:tetratricopeptide (TPR) repeat protein